MKQTLLIICLLMGFPSFSQTSAEKEILKLSEKIFTWEVTNQIDSLEKVFDEKFVVVGGDGSSQYKKQYITVLRSGNFVHNSIDVSENVATVVNNTATVVGKGKFTVTVSGKEISLLLSYIEVFTRPNKRKPWTVLAMHATVLEK
jgi:Domain of unknown function (DUF4440)